MRARLAAVVMVAGVAVAARTARADSEAGQHFKRAQAAERAKKWAQAIEEYERAYDLSPQPDVLYNIAVDQEHLEEWTEAADTFQHYLDDDEHREGAAKDADAVKERIRADRDKAAAKAGKTGEPPVDQGTGSGGTSNGGASNGGGRTIPVGPDGTVGGDPTGVSTAHLDNNPTTPSSLDQTGLAGAAAGSPGVTGNGEPVVPGERAFSRWHLAASYGVALGNEPSERYELRGGLRLAGHLDIDLVGGTFGTNDYAVGAMMRVVISANLPVQPVLIGAATVGLAKQDASSNAGYRVPLGVEGGAGLQFGKHGRLELDALVRYLTNGWGSDETSAFTYVNDTLAFAIDLGAAVDIPVISGAH
jgi:hypothetical protein